MVEGVAGVGDVRGDMRFNAVLREGRFLWATDGWWWWIPGQHLLVHTWNWICCWRWGHNDCLWHLLEGGHIPAEDACCIHCSTLLTSCTCRSAKTGKAT